MLLVTQVIVARSSQCWPILRRTCNPTKGAKMQITMHTVTEPILMFLLIVKVFLKPISEDDVVVVLIIIIISIQSLICQKVAY